jgi:hypothetical protein
MNATVSTLPFGASALIHNASQEAWVKAYEIATHLAREGFRPEVCSIADPKGEETAVRVLLCRKSNSTHNELCAALRAAVARADVSLTQAKEHKL